MDYKAKMDKAAIFAKEGHFGLAESLYIELLHEYPDDVKLLTIYGYLCLKTKEFQKAEPLFKRAFELSHEGKIIKGYALTEYFLKKYDEAIKLYVKLIHIENAYENYRVLTSMLANKISLNDEKFLDIAKKYILEAYSKFPLKPEIMVNYATYCFYVGNFDEAEKVCRYALKIDDKTSSAWELLGFIYEGIYCDEEKAQECHKKTIELGNIYSGNYNLGISYSKTGQYDKADIAFNSALDISQQNSSFIIKAKAENYLVQRNFKEGYKLFVNSSNSPLFDVLENRWDGSDGHGKTIFVILDMCYGDHIFFARYLPFLKEKFAKVYVQTNDNIKQLFENSFNDILFTDFDVIPEYDYYVPISHLPYYLNMDFDNIPYSSGYMKSDSENINTNKLKVGICWEAGNKDIRDTIHRTINIKEFENLFKESYDFYSLQLNPAMDYSKYNLIDLSDKIHDFADTARYLTAMDILVSVDTSVSNLAGALGVRTFMFIPYYADWRWFDNDKTTEWYDSVTLYKQTEKHSWQNEINRVICDLKNL